jgi:hypothetical protein
MANKRSEPVSYRPFRAEPLLAEGLLAVQRPGGDLMERTSAGLFRLAAQAGQVADRQRAAQGARDGQRAALDGRPSADVAPGAPAAAGGGQVATPDRITRSMRGDVRAIVSEAAQRHGVDPNALLTIAMIESSGNPGAKNPNSSAGGLFQFIDSTARQYGLKDKFDPAQAADAAARLAKDNAAHLRKALGREPTGGELYLAHQQGAGGAAKLLANPSASAASIVGGDAVRLNGGREGMTAGEFANLWIRKAGGATAGVDPVTTAGTRGTPGTVTVSGGTYRPGGSDTIYGRARDEAGTRTYLQLVETEMRSTTSQLFERYRDDPAGLETALGDLKGVLKRDHIFPEIEADYEVGFGNMAARYLDQARENLARKVEAQNRTDFIERTGTLETEQQRRMADFDPASPDAADAIAASQAAIDDHYDSAVARGILSPEAAASAKLTSRREAALGFYGKQAEALDADGVKAMREEMRADFADGGLEGLDGDGFATLDAGLEKLEKVKRLEAEKATVDFRKRGDAMAARLAAGFEIDKAELSKLMTDSGATPQGKEALQETFAKISAGRAIRDMTVAQGNAYVAGLRKQYGDSPTDAQLRSLQFASAMLEQKKIAIQTDSVSYAEAQGLVPPTPMLTEAATAEDMSAIMVERTAAAETAARELHTTTRYLKAGEAKALADAVKANPATGVGIAGAIVAGAGDAAPAVLAEFGTEAPMISEAGAIIAFGGSARAAEDVILGYGKSADGKPLKGLKADAARESFASVAGEALVMADKDRARIDRAAAAISRKRITEEGIDPASDEALAVHAQAVQEAAGAVFDRNQQYGGFVDYGEGLFSGGSKVLVPSAIRADMFGDVIDAIAEDDLAGLTVKPKAGFAGFAPFGLFTGERQAKSLKETIAGALPVAVAGGYAFAFGDPASEDPQFIEGEDGRPFVLDVMAMREKLAARVPRAFR